jgi:hypothetical protein
MESIQLKTHVGHDGLLQIKLPEQIANSEVEVVVIYQPVDKTKKRSWSPGFFERTFGAWVGEPLVREPQGEFPQREPLV